MNDGELMSTIVIVDQRPIEVTAHQRSLQSSLLTVERPRP
jgi:transcription termination factor Rho